MMIWCYKILTNNGIILTKDSEYAEKKSKLGNLVFCRRQSNHYKYNH